MNLNCKPMWMPAWARVSLGCQSFDDEALEAAGQGIVDATLWMLLM